MTFFNSFTCNHFVFNIKAKYSEYLRVLIFPTRGVLLCPFWMTIILMMYSVAGFRAEQKHHISHPVNSLVLNKNTKGGYFKTTLVLFNSEIRFHYLDKKWFGPTSYDGVVLANVGLWDELLRGSSSLFIGDVVSGDLCGRRLPGEGDGCGGQRCKLEAGRSLDHGFNCEEEKKSCVSWTIFKKNIPNKWGFHLQ